MTMGEEKSPAVWVVEFAKLLGTEGYFREDSGRMGVMSNDEFRIRLNDAVQEALRDARAWRNRNTRDTAAQEARGVLVSMVKDNNLQPMERMRAAEILLSHGGDT